MGLISEMSLEIELHNCESFVTVEEVQRMKKHYDDQLHTIQDNIEKLLKQEREQFKTPHKVASETVKKRNVFHSFDRRQDAQYEAGDLKNLGYTNQSFNAMIDNSIKDNHVIDISLGKR